MNADHTFAGAVSFPDPVTADKWDDRAAWAAAEAAKADYHAALAASRPSFVVGATISRLPDRTVGEPYYLCEYGAVYGFGSTPEEACADFDRAWFGA